MTRLQRFWLGLLVCAVILSGIAVVYAKNQSRDLFRQLQETRKTHQQELITWGQWQLELATQGNLQHVSQVARARLDMHIPQNNQYLLVDTHEGE